MHVSDIKPVLLQNSWFASLPTHLAEALITKGKLKTLNDKQILHKKNDLADGFHCVLDGRIRVSNFTKEGKELVLTWIQAGNWFGEISLIDGQPRTHDAYAEGKTTLLKVPTPAFDSLATEHPDWQQYLMQLLCQRVRSTFSLIDETGCLSLKGLLCKRLSLMFQGLADQNQPTQQPALSISQDALAQLIHSSRQTVNKILQGLQAENIIALRYGKIEILDIQGLERHSQI